MKQTDRVLQYMRYFGSITPLQALGDLGVMRLGARIWDLRREGHHITRRMVSGKNRYGEATSYAEYRLKEGGIKMLKEMQISDIPTQNKRNERNEGKWIKELNKFYESGAVAAELFWETSQSALSVVNAVRAAAKHKNIPVIVVKRGDRIFFVRGDANA